MNALLNYSFGNYILPNTKNIIPEVGFGQRPIKRFPFLRVSFYRDNFMHLGYHNQKLLTAFLEFLYSHCVNSHIH